MIGWLTSRLLLHALVYCLGNLEEVGHVILRRPNQDAMPQVHDMPGALGCLDCVNHALLNGVLRAEEHPRVHVPL